MKSQNLAEEMPYMSPMINREDASREKGYTESFEIEAIDRMVGTTSHKTYTPDQVRFVNHYRFEGMSDPGDNNILYEVETSDGAKGILITPYGPDCPAHIADFVALVPEIEKQRAGEPQVQGGGDRSVGGIGSV